MAIKALFGTKEAGSVAEILSDFSAKVIQLREPATRKKEEAAQTLVEVQQLQQKASETAAEAGKAETAANKIESFLVD